MSGSVIDKLVLDSGLNSLSPQITGVKRTKTVKLNLLRKGLKRFEDDPNNLKVWKTLQVLKEKAEDCGEAFTILRGVWPKCRKSWMTGRMLTASVLWLLGMRLPLPSSPPTIRISQGEVGFCHSWTAGGERERELHGGGRGES